MAAPSNGCRRFRPPITAMATHRRLLPWGQTALLARPEGCRLRGKADQEALAATSDQDMLGSEYVLAGDS